MVDGKSGFLYFDKNESICYSLHWEHYFQHIIQKYNNTYKVQMPVITPCYFQLKIVITQPESGQLLPWHPQDLHAYMYSALR